MSLFKVDHMLIDSANIDFWVTVAACEDAISPMPCLVKVNKV